MEKACYRKRKCKIFVVQRFSMGRLYSSYDNGSLTGQLENRFLFMPLPLAQIHLRHLLTRMGEFPSIYTDTTLTGEPAPVSRSYLTLRSMAQIALETQKYAPHDPLFPAGARVPSSFCTALDTVSTHDARANKHG
jgi:hypothetical protein